jgi:ERCC4-type nuclease
MPAVDVEEVTLETGDYAIKEYANHDPKRDTWVPRFAVERKAQGDFLNSITWERERFNEEIRRADGWPVPITVIVESPRSTFEDETHYRDVSSNQVFGTIDAWANNYNCEFYFREDRVQAAELAFDFLSDWYRDAERGRI